MRAPASVWFAVRFAGYLVAVGLCQVAVGAAIKRTSWLPVLVEQGWLEQVQALVLVATVLGFVAVGIRSPSRRRLYALLAWVSLCALVRESDHLAVYRSVPNPIRIGAASTGFLVLLLWGRGRLLAEARALLGRPAALLLAQGALLVVLWAQVMGDRALWRLLYGKRFAIGSRLVEEGLELGGYLLLLFALLEELLDRRRRHRPRLE